MVFSFFKSVVTGDEESLRMLSRINPDILIRDRDIQSQESEEIRIGLSRRSGTRFIMKEHR